MNRVAEPDRLPRTIGGLLGFAFQVLAANAGLYALLSAGVFAAYAAVEMLLPTVGAETPGGQFKLYVLLFTGIFVDALVIATVALAVASRAAGKTAASGALLSGGIERWLRVISISALAQAVQILTSPVDGLGASPLPHAALYVVAPVTWLLWAILDIAAPLAALAPEQGAIAVSAAFVRACSLPLQRVNLFRLCVLALLLLLPVLAETLLQNVLQARHVPRAFFWANAPIDALTIALWSAVATVFVLDFARRADQRSA